MKPKGRSECWEDIGEEDRWKTRKTGGKRGTQEA